MRFRHTIAALGGAAALLLSCPLAATAAGASSTPTTTQIRKAIRTAEGSSSLWATINICRAHRVGIRGQMPSLGFVSGSYMTFDVYYYVPATNQFRPVPHTKERIYLGRASTNVHQGGYTFHFSKRVTLAAKVKFTWKLNGKVIGSVRRNTTGGHKRVDQGNPPGYSAAVCTLR